MVLSSQYLAFAKHFDKEAASQNAGPLQKWQDELLESVISADDLKILFHQHDKDNSMFGAVQVVEMCKCTNGGS